MIQLGLCHCPPCPLSLHSDIPFLPTHPGQLAILYCPNDIKIQRTLINLQTLVTAHLSLTVLSLFLSRLWLCTFTLSVAVCAVLLLPISILSNEVLLIFPHSYYMQWLNGSLIHGTDPRLHHNTQYRSTLSFHSSSFMVRAPIAPNLKHHSVLTTF